MLSIARARSALPTQLLFLGVNGGGIFFGVLYNAKTPDLYANNAHHKIGWLATCVVVAQVAMSLIFALSSRRCKKEVAAMPAETVSFLPMSIEAMAQHQQLHDPQRYKDTRQLEDSGQGTERASSSLVRSRDSSPTHTPYSRQDYEQCPKLEAEDEDDDDTQDVPPFRNFSGSIFAHRALKRRAPAVYVQRALKVFERLCDGIDRTVLILGFIALLTGGVTYGGIFVSA